MIITTGDCQQTAPAIHQPTNSVFTRFSDQDAANSLAEGLRFHPNAPIHPLCIAATEGLQRHLAEQTEWQHNFGLGNGGNGAVIGKMFGVLAVRARDGSLGYLAAFSGKLANGNHHKGFVEPVFDALTAGSFLNTGMARLAEINAEIAKLELAGDLAAADKRKEARKSHSIALQRKLHEHYNFRNKTGRTRNLIDIFEAHGYKQPPAGAGECAGPKLLQYAFRHHMEPLALAEFWWGLSPKSATWKHGEFYPPCKEKCAPILDFMLSE